MITRTSLGAFGGTCGEAKNASGSTPATKSSISDCQKVGDLGQWSKFVEIYFHRYLYDNPKIQKEGVIGGGRGRGKGGQI